MKNKPKNYYSALAVMVGYIIGVGMFGLPFLTAKSGVLVFLALLIGLAFVQHLIHLLYANLILTSEEYHRLPGFAEKYLGKKWKIIILVAKMIGNYGALLAYIIITGIFLNQLLGPIFGGNEFFYATLLFMVEAIILFFGISVLARAELIMTSLLLLVVCLVVWRGFGESSISNYSLIDWKLALLPFGAMLFALDGNGSVPIVTRLLKRDKEAVKSVIRWGTFIPAIVILFFTLSVLGMSGSSTTPDAITGIKDILGNGILQLALFFGVLTMTTSFLGSAESLREILNWDFKVNKRLAWAIAVFGPYILYLAGFKDLIEIISFAGAIMGGFCAISLLLIFMKLKKADQKILLKYRPGKLLFYFLFSLFAFGIIYEVYYFFVK